MRRKFDVFSFFAIFFVVWYIFTASVYILEFYADIKIAALLGERVAYPIMLIATLGGLLVGEYQLVIVAWSPIVALIIGIAGWISREKSGKYFIIFPCLSLVAQVFLIFAQGTQLFAFLYYAFPVLTIFFLLLWVMMDLLILIKER